MKKLSLNEPVSSPAPAPKAGSPGQWVNIENAYQRRAHELLDFGDRPIPVGMETKKTLVRWQPWLDKLSHDAIDAYWQRNPQAGLGIIVDDQTIVLDADSPDSLARLRALIEEHGLTCNWIQQTRKGMHYRFRRASSTMAWQQGFSTVKSPEKIDVKTGRSATEGLAMVVVAPSPGKTMQVDAASCVGELVEVGQDFIDAVWQANGKEAPRPYAPRRPHGPLHDTGLLGELLARIKPDCDYDRWLAVLMALHFEMGGSADGLELACQWSAGYDSEVEEKWDSFDTDAANPVGLGTLKKFAAEEGWCELKSLLARVEKLPKDAEHGEITTLAEATSSLDEEEAESVFAAMKKKTGIPLGRLRKLCKRAQIKAREAMRALHKQEKTSFQYDPLEVDSFPDLSINPVTGTTSLRTTLNNVNHLLKGYGVTSRYNTVTRKMEITVPNLTTTMDNADNVSLSHVVSMGAVNGLNTSMLPEYVFTIADGNKYNPVAEWIMSEPWDGVPRLGMLFDTVTVAEGYPIELRNLLMRRWMISAVAAQFEPTFRTRGVLTMQGAQELGKTQWLQSLVPQPLCAQVVRGDLLLDPSNKDSVLAAVRHWLVELGELESTFKNDMGRLKGFLTSHMDKVRPPYARLESEYPRRTVFFASVNDPQFLKDDTGNTRFWVMEVKAVNYDHRLPMQQIWAEAYALYAADEKWWLSREESAQLETSNKSFRTACPYREELARRLDMEAPKELWTPRFASTLLIELGYQLPDKSQMRAMGAALRDQFGDPRRLNGHNTWDLPPLKTPKNT
jgi:putative DNA primase/helicase